MRRLMIASLCAMIAAPAAALTPPAQPVQAQPLRELPEDFLDDADIDIGSARAVESEDGVVRSDSNARKAERPYQCEESSGTTGLILGAVAGGLLGNVMDGGDKRTLGTLVGAGGGALLGREIEKKRAAAGCK